MEYKRIQGMPEGNDLKEILAFYQDIFRPEANFLEEMKTKRNLVTFVALVDGDMVGFKMGYDRKENHFYSWLGGVSDFYRGQGVASELMKQQHQWCREAGYHAIRTHTKNKWKAMLILNLRHGFDVIGTYTYVKGEPKIILEKRLD
ncbi:MAG TPA: GNAT family N-acetyltransferase [Bacillales bacterium]|nr:GNAT family N-acetyltransferase [Bacillales bacterium]